MNLHFNKLTMHNFLSYKDAELVFNTKGFCLVSGENHCAQDNAISNGSGKTSIWSALCYALTGETVQGLSTNLKNLNIDEDSCFVTVDLTVNKDNYIITRIYKPKSDLKIYKNDVDISGKGIRESEMILEANLPDLNRNLISSILILGQGLPNKFSSFSPSGRKELLEKLTKSDFMINDIKNRVIERQLNLSNTITQYANSILVNNTTLQNTKQLYDTTTKELNSLNTAQFDSNIKDLQTQLAQLETKLKEKQDLIQQQDINITNYSSDLIKLSTEQTAEYTTLLTTYNDSIKEDQQLYYSLEAEIKVLTTSIKQLKSVIDTCPTCGQKLPNIIKPDTSGQEQDLYIKQQQLNQVKTKLQQAQQKYEIYTLEINNTYQKQIEELQKNLQLLKQEKENVQTDITNILSLIASQKEKSASIITLKNSAEKRKATLEIQLEQQQNEIHNLQNLITISTIAKTELEEHLAVIKKMETLIKRDFRGYLLTNIINYINQKAKDYCQIVFNTTALSVKLNGNVLDISYDNKFFDNLSGGEKQRCDIILQLALRDLLQTYLNYTSNILVLDEVFDNLDHQATAKIIDLINYKLKDVESIFIVSHHATELSLPIDSELHVIKNEFGISELSLN